MLVCQNLHHQVAAETLAHLLPLQNNCYPMVRRHQWKVTVKGKWANRTAKTPGPKYQSPKVQGPTHGNHPSPNTLIYTPLPSQHMTINGWDQHRTIQTNHSQPGKIKQNVVQNIIYSNMDQMIEGQQLRPRPATSHCTTQRSKATQASPPMESSNPRPLSPAHDK